MQTKVTGGARFFALQVNSITAYSQRAFARRLGMNSGSLSSLFGGKRSLSPKTTQKILARLQLGPNYRDWISQVLATAKGHGPKIERTLLDLDRFETIASPLGSVGFGLSTLLVGLDYVF